jgi:multidrug efflux pump subunit AcrA (membrane-fusion protein)
MLKLFDMLKTNNEHINYFYVLIKLIETSESGTMKKFIIIFISLVALAAIAYYFISKDSGDESEDVLVKPTVGEFKVTVVNSGELKAKNSIDIMGPSNARTVRIWDMKISKLIPEGTVVDSGAFVAELDKSEIVNKIKDRELEISKLESQFKQAKLDSALELSQQRDNLDNLQFNLEEKKLLIEQSKYEAPAVIRQAQMDYERTERSYKQALKNYKTKVEQSITKINIVKADLMKERKNLELVMEIMQGFTINAPAKGMVIYARNWNGTRKVVGSNVSSWDPVVATLPDLRYMESVTYISEIDIQKIKKGQKVKIKLDADPDKRLSGEIARVANIGEQLRNSDSKVFEVLINIDQSDTTLRPSMTTSNDILVATVDSALFIPLECIHSEDGASYVYIKNNGQLIKQEVRLGLMNENEAIIEEGVSPEDNLLMNTPDDKEKFELKKLPPQPEKTKEIEDKPKKEEPKIDADSIKKQFMNKGKEAGND